MAIHSGSLIKCYDRVSDLKLVLILTMKAAKMLAAVNIHLPRYLSMFNLNRSA